MVPCDSPGLAGPMADAARALGNVTVQVEAAPPDPERLADLGTVFGLFFVAAVAIFCARRLLDLFKVNLMTTDPHALHHRNDVRRRLVAAALDRLRLIVATLAALGCIALAVPASAAPMTRSVMSNGFQVLISGRSATFGTFGSASSARIAGATPVGAGWSSALGATKAAGGVLELAAKNPTKLGGAVVDVVAKVKITPAQLAKAIAKPTAGMAIALAASLALKPLLDEACLRLRGGRMELAAGAEWEECVTTAPGPVMKWATTNDASTFYGDPEQACLANKPANYRYTHFELTGEDSGKCMRSVGGTPDNYWFLIGQRMCGDKPAKYQSGAWVCAEPSQPSGQYVPVTPDEAISKLQTKIPESNSLPDIAREILGSGGEIDADDTTVSGPSEVANPKIEEDKTVKETPDPQPNNPNAKRREETTTKTKTSEKLTYDKDTVSAREKKEEERCIKVITGAGQESTACDGAVTESTKPKGEDSDLCKLHPEILACKEIDVPDGEIPKQSRELTYREESIFGSGSCPADRFVTIAGQQLKVADWGRDCELIAQYYRPLFLAVGALISFFILIPARTDV